MKFSGKTWLMIILKATENQVLILPLESTFHFFGKTARRDEIYFGKPKRLIYIRPLDHLCTSLLNGKRLRNFIKLANIGF